jgi:hypothetical protein
MTMAATGAAMAVGAGLLAAPAAQADDYVSSSVAIYSGHAITGTLLGHGKNGDGITIYQANLDGAAYNYQTSMGGSSSRKWDNGIDKATHINGWSEAVWIL